MADIAEQGGLRVPPRRDRPGSFGGIGGPTPFLDDLARYLSDPRERAKARESLRPLPGEGLIPGLLPTEIIKGIGEFAETLPGFAEQNARLEGKLGPDAPSIIPGAALAAGVVRGAGKGAKGAAKSAARFVVEPKPAGGAVVRDTATNKVVTLHKDVAAAERVAQTRNSVEAAKAPTATKAEAEALFQTADNARLDAALGGVAPDVKSTIRKIMRGEDGQSIDSLSPETQQAIFAAQHKALSGAGLPVNDATVGGLMDRLVAEAVKVNSITAARGRKLTQTEKAAGRAQAAARPAAGPRATAKVAEPSPVTQEPYPSSVQPGVAPTIQHVREAQPVQATTLFESAADDAGRGTLRPNPNLPPSGGGLPPTTTRPQGGGGFDFGAALSELVNFPRALRATVDISQLLRQGLIPMVSAALSTSPTRRVIARDAFKNAIRGYGDKYAGEVWERAMKDPLFQKWKEAGAFERTVPARSLEHLQKAGGKEELFQSGLAERLPIAGRAVVAAERSYGLTLNALAFETWKQVYNAAKANGKILTPVEQKALAKWMNIATGRGSLGELSGASKALNAILFAPRFVISRFQAPVEVVRLLANPETRRIGLQAEQDLAKTVVAGVGIMNLAELAGMKVGWDPTSSDFGKIRVGDITIDIWGGFAQPAVFAARLALDQYTSGGKTASLSQGGFTAPDATDIASRFVRSKVSPTVGLFWSLVEGKDFAGKPFGPRGGMSPEETAKQIASQTVVPLSVENTVETILSDLTRGTSQERGLPPGTIGVAAALAGATGVGVQAYERPVVRDGIGRNIDDDPPPSLALDVWNAAVERAKQRAKTTGGAPEMPELTPPDKYIGSGEQRITLDDIEADRLKVLVGQERERALTQLAANPAFLTLDARRQESLLKSTKAEADRAGQQAFSIELARAALDETGRVRAVSIGLKASEGRGDRMDFIARIASEGVLNAEMEGAIDDLRLQTDPAKPNYEPTVNEYLTWSANAQRYTSAPPWRVGDPTVWAAVSREAARLRGVYADLRREADARGVPVQKLADYKQYAADYGASVVGSVQGRPLKTAAFIDLSGDVRKEMLSPQRAQIESLPLWGKFSDAIKKRDPYAIR